jgi:hypothetical protein
VHPLYEKQVLLGDDVGLIDLDDSALGPPELDVGNLLSHLELLARRSGRDLGPMGTAFLDGYLTAGASLDAALLTRCRTLSLLRLACLHRTRSCSTSSAARKLRKAGRGLRPTTPGLMAAQPAKAGGLGLLGAADDGGGTGRRWGFSLGRTRGGMSPLLQELAEGVSS